MAPDPWGVASVVSAPSNASDPWGVAKVDDDVPATSGSISGVGAVPVPVGLQGAPAKGLGSSASDVLTTVGRHALNSVAGPVMAVAAPPQGTAEKVANMAMPGGLAAYRTLIKPSVAPAQRAIQQVGQGDFSGAARSAESAIPIVGPWADQVESDVANKGAVAGLAGLATDVLAPKAAAGVVKAIPGAADSTARGIIKQTVGLRGKDFARGADPVGAYFDNNIGPSTSMNSIAEKAGDARTEVGQELGTAYTQADASGKLIPADTVRKAIHPVIDEAKGKAGSPGVISDPSAYQALKDSFEPAFQAADAKGGFTPSELWNIRKAMNESLNWGDQSRLNLTKTQQRVSGALGGVLEKAVPETAELNKNYQGITKLANRATQQSTASPSLSQYAGRTALGVGGSAIGHVIGGGTPGAGVAGGVLAQAVNSVPFKTAVASGLNVAGKVLRPVGSLAQSAALPATLAGVANRDIPQEAEDSSPELVQEQPDDSASENFDHLSPTASSIAPSSVQPVQPVSAQNGNQQVLPVVQGAKPVIQPVPVPQSSLQKGTPISLNGSSGRVEFAHPQRNVARVRMDDGSSRTVRASDLKILNHAIVKQHVRKLPERT